MTYAKVPGSFAESSLRLRRPLGAAGRDILGEPQGQRPADSGWLR
jgi:hypothetical protein